MDKNLNCIHKLLLTYSASLFKKGKGHDKEKELPMHDGRLLSHARLSPVMHLSVALPCRVYPCSQPNDMSLPAK